MACQLLLFKHSVDEAQQHQHVLFIKLLHPIDGLLNQFRILRAFIEKLLWGEAKIFANCKELLHRRRSFARGYIVDVAAAVPEVITHLVF